jgi:hypothetical protein
LMSKKRSRWRQIDHEFHRGPGQCAACGTRAHWRYWIKIGTKDQLVYLCDEHKEEYRPE